VDGTITVTGTTGGTSVVVPTRTYTHYIVRTAPTSATITESSGVFTGLSAGTYEVYAVAEADGVTPECEKLLETVTIWEPTSVSSSTTKVNISRYDLDDASIEFAAPTGGTHDDETTRTYEYYIVRNGTNDWAQQSSASFTGLEAGTYTTYVVALASSDGTTPTCTTYVDQQVIYRPSAVTASIATTNISCNASIDAVITVTGADGGIHAEADSRSYEYLISGQEDHGPTTSSTFSGLSAGTYTVTVRALAVDGENPESNTDISTSVVIYEPTVVGTSSSVATVDPTCYGGSDGSIDVQGGTGGTHDLATDRTYQYSITKLGEGGSTTGPQTSTSFTGLTSGTYNVYVTTLATTNGSAVNPECVTNVDQVVVNDPPMLEVTFTDNANTSAPFVRATETVTFTLSVTGGTPPYTYQWQSKPSGVPDYPTVVSWDDNTGSGTFELTSIDPDLVSGSYTIRVLDAGACPPPDGDETTVVNAYARETYYVNNKSTGTRAGSDVTGTGTSSKPLGSITKAIEVAEVSSPENTINIIQSNDGSAVAYNEGANGPIITKPLTFRRVDVDLYQVNLEPLFTSPTSFVLATSTCTFTGFSPTTLYVNGDNSSGLDQGSIQKAIDLVSSTGFVMLLPGEWQIASPLTISKGITIAGPEPTNTDATSCDLNPTAQISAAGTTKMMLFSGVNAKTVRNLIMRVGQTVAVGTTTTGRYFEIQAGSSANVSVSNMIFKHHRAQGANDTVRLYGITNANYSAGALNDVAKFVNDADDNAGFGTGRVLFGRQGPLPWSTLEIGWKAEDGGSATDGALITNLYSMTTRNTTRLVASTATRPALKTTGINNRAAFEFIGATRVMSATPNAAVMTGAQKTLFTVFKTPNTASFGSTTRQVVYKQGDHQTGMSVVLVGTTGTTYDLILSVYNNAGTQYTATKTFTGLALNSTYMTQMYFNGSDATRRVAMSVETTSGFLGGASSDGTYTVNGTDFPVTTIYQHPTYQTAQSISLGARVGGVRWGTDNTTDVATAAGASMYLGKGTSTNAALVSEVLVYTTADANTRDAAYCYLRNKYLGNNTVDNDLMKPGNNGETIAGDVDFEDQIELYPNPAESDLNITVAVRQPGRMKVEIVDALGRIVSTLFDDYATTNFILPMTADVSKLTNGAYILRATGANDLNLSQPFIIRR
jgi:uncharacterized protein (DUF2141 family)